MYEFIEFLLIVEGAPSEEAIKDSIELLLRYTSLCPEIFQYLFLLISGHDEEFRSHKWIPSYLLIVFTEILRSYPHEDSPTSPFGVHFRLILPWLTQVILRENPDHPEEYNIVIGWKQAGFISSVEFEIIMNPDKFKYDDFKTIDIETTGAGTLCATLTSHLRLSHGDYGEVVFRNGHDVATAFRKIQSCSDVDVEEFIRNFS